MNIMYVLKYGIHTDTHTHITSSRFMKNSIYERIGHTYLLSGSISGCVKSQLLYDWNRRRPISFVDYSE